MSTERAPRILVIRLSALGDVVMASGLIPALRSIHPQAHLAWLVEPAAAPLLAANPRIDELIVWPRGQWQQWWRERRVGELWRAARALRRRLRDARFDLVLDAQGLLKSGIWSWLSDAPRRISLYGREGSRWLATEVLHPASEPGKPIAAEYRALARHLGAADAAFTPDLSTSAAAAQRAGEVLVQAGVADSFAVLAPFTTRPQKHWFEDRWAELASELAASGLRPLLLGAPADRDAAARIVAMTPAAAGLVDLVGATKLDESAALIARAALLVGVDTGLTHMGSALAVPTVALFGSTRPYLDARAPATRVLYEPLPCSPCKRHPTCGGRFDCMRLHTPAGVMQAAREVLARQATLARLPRPIIPIAAQR